MAWFQDMMDNVFPASKPLKKAAAGVPDPNRVQGNQDAGLDIAKMAREQAAKRITAEPAATTDPKKKKKTMADQMADNMKAGYGK